MTNEKRDPAAELHELPEELHELPSMPAQASVVEETPAGPPASLTEIESGAVGSSGGERPPLRVLDKAPRHVALAAKIVVAGALLPFMKPTSVGADGNVWMSFAAKVVMLGAAWLWLQQVHHNWGRPKLTGFLAGLADLTLRPKPSGDAAKKSRRAQKTTSIEHPFPTGLHLVSLLLIVGSIPLSISDPRQGLLGPVGLAELGVLGWAAFSYVHVVNYERWGSFNPLFPLMFLGMLFAGVASVVAALSASGIWMLFHGIGGAAVGAGGGLAAYSIVEAMMQAKKEGDAKKTVELEKRKAARESRKKGV